MALSIFVSVTSREISFTVWIMGELKVKVALFVKRVVTYAEAVRVYIKPSIYFNQINSIQYLSHYPWIICNISIPDVDYLCLLCIDFYVWDAVSTFNHLPRMFSSTDFAFWITDYTCCHGPYLHAILRIISRGVSGLATDSPCGVWGRGWTTCLLHDSPLFGSHFKMRVGM